MFRLKSTTCWLVLSLTAVTSASGYLYAQQPPREAQPRAQGQAPPPNPYLMGTEGLNQGPRGLTSYQPIAIAESFQARRAAMVGEKPAVEQAHNALLNE